MPATAIRVIFVLGICKHNLPDLNKYEAALNTARRTTSSFDRVPCCIQLIFISLLIRNFLTVRCGGRQIHTFFSPLRRLLLSSLQVVVLHGFQLITGGGLRVQPEDLPVQPHKLLTIGKGVEDLCRILVKASYDQSSAQSFCSVQLERSAIIDGVGSQKVRQDSVVPLPLQPSPRQLLHSIPATVDSSQTKLFQERPVGP
mmetsp:Transcript_34384/g.92045  ORF Transcript_34384/g.92045 Transcript_34384/m.92045 type:complete len:200 (-) Transcript_34384:323-922(-)